MDVKKKEEEILKFWKEAKIPEKARSMNKGGKKFYFLDGPPYATGYIHMGTALNKILKDSYIRAFRMLGYDVWDRPGYDTHGLPIENKVEKKLGFKGKKDIEAFGVKNFVQECKKFATQFIDVMNNQFWNLGVWMDWEKPYLTLTNEYIEGAWATFKQAFEKGFLYRGKYPVHVCPHCETAVAYNEIEYKNVSDPSIYVKFKVKGKENEFLLIWTTTPWTLPSNTGVMVKPSADYVKVKVGDEVWIVAEALLEKLMEKFGVESYEVVAKVKGSELVGLRYENPLFGLCKFHEDVEKNNGYRVVGSEQYVSLEEGTGLVHTAPGHGQEDYRVGLENGLPMVSPVKMNGSYDETCEEFAGMFVKDADEKIIQILQEKGALVKREKINHEYPHCWRCKSPLLLISVPQWFFKVTGIRDKLIEENKKVNWVPEWAGKRFENWLQSLGDWPISRQRYWGIPLPIWVCDSCGHVIVVDSRKELEELGAKVPDDLHKPEIDEVTFKCPKCGGVMKRVKDVLDVWFDSGVAPWASLGYPKDKKLLDELWPVDLEIEGPDQIRGWWNSQAITSVLTFGEIPFRNVVYHGFVLDAHGVKMSKSLGNIVAPEDVIEKYGRDVLRFFLLSSAPWDDFYFKWEDVDDIAKKFVVVRNTFNFVKMYVESFEEVSYEQLKEEDKWILSKLNSLVKEVKEYYRKFLGHKASQAVMNFLLEDFSRWYIKLIRDRVWPLYEGPDKKAAFYTLAKVAFETLKLFAPTCPFLVEEVWQGFMKDLVKGKESIHLYTFPEVNEELIDKELEENMEKVRNLTEVVLALRQEAGLKLRWVAKELVLVSSDERLAKAVEALEGVLKRAANVKQVRVSQQEPSGNYVSKDFEQGKIFLNMEVDEEILKERFLRELVRKIQDLRKKAGFDVRQKIKIGLVANEESKKLLDGLLEELKHEVNASDIVMESVGSKRGSLTFEKASVEIWF